MQTVQQFERKNPQLIAAIFGLDEISKRYEEILKQSGLGDRLQNAVSSALTKIQKDVMHPVKSSKDEIIFHAEYCIEVIEDFCKG